MAYRVQFADEAAMKPLRWKNGKIPIALSTSLIKQNFSIRNESDTVNAIRRSLLTWEKVTNVEFEVSWTDLQSLSPSGNSGDGVSLITIAPTSENLVLFGNETGDVSARTRVFFNRKGFINEADIVLNPYQQFSTDGAIGTFDLEATITHELGHLLGLEHSSVISSTMYAQQRKNGTLNLSGFSLRTLAEDDIAGIRSLYGAKNAEKDCCGQLHGKLIQTDGKPAKNMQVWAEEAETGRVMGEVLTVADGSFLFEGLVEGIYRIYTQETSDKVIFGAAEELGEIKVKKGKTLNITKKLKDTPNGFGLLYAGFNGQLSELAVPLNDGKSYTVYIGGKNLDTKSVHIDFNSPFFSITPGTITTHDFGSQVSVVSFEVNVKSQTPPGEYSFIVIL
ncbi:MAG: matrixin family metalloprotease [Acidobacteria bacterium]|nr:matrixin family metalloprotease [Acidobacteriota bacterium]